MDRQWRAFELLKAGRSLRSIARELGVSHVQVKRDTDAVIATLNAHALTGANEWRRLELERLDELWHGIWPAASSGHILAIDRAIKIMERRAKLLGLDAPQQIDLTIRERAAQLADELGLSADELIAEAERIAAGVGG